MDRIEKALRRLAGNDKERVFSVLDALFIRDFTTLDRKRLKGYECIYRIRVGNYRIIYFDDGHQIILKAVQRRNEKTYRDF